MGLDTCVAGEGRVVFSPSPPLALRLFKPIGCCQRVIGCEGSSSCTNALHSGETRREGGWEKAKPKREKASALYGVLPTLHPIPPFQLPFHVWVSLIAFQSNFVCSSWLSDQREFGKPPGIVDNPLKMKDGIRRKEQKGNLAMDSKGA